MKFHPTAHSRSAISVTVVTTIVLSFFAVSAPALARKDSHPRANRDPAPATTTDEASNDELALLPSSSSQKQQQQDGDVACAAAYRSAQEQEESNHLVEATELWLACTKPTCATPLQRACMAKHAQMQLDIPTIVPMAIDAKGAPWLDVQVKMDGEQLAAHIDGRAIAVNPGMHEFTFIADGNVISTQKILVAQGQRNRMVSVSLRPEKGADQPEGSLVAGAGTDAAADTSPKTHIPGLSWALGGVGLVGIGGYALLTTWGRKDNDKLGQCSPACPQSTVDHIHKLYMGADISLGVGIAALGAAYWAYALKRSANEEAEPAPTREAVVFGVQPTPSGGVGTISGKF
jgi:hypothetical protein